MTEWIKTQTLGPRLSSGILRWPVLKPAPQRGLNGHFYLHQGRQRRVSLPGESNVACRSDLSEALEELAEAQKASNDEHLYSARATQVLVETAMFAAMGGLAFSVAAVLKLQGYMGYLLPMPIVLSAIRSGPAVARKTAAATAFLLFVLLGPLQAVSYLLQHGCTAWALGTGWYYRLPWTLSILSASIVRVLGTIGFLAFTSWTLNENVYRILVTQIHALVEQLSVLLRVSGSPSPLTIQVFMAASLLVNCLMYIALLHVMYAIFLSSMGYKAVELPAFIQKRLMPMQ